MNAADLLQSIRIMLDRAEAGGGNARDTIREIQDLFAANEGHGTAILPKPRALEITRPIAFLDLETTGLSLTDDSVWEIAIKKILPGNPTPLYFHALCNPGRPLTPEAAEKTGMNDAELATHPPFSHFAKEIHEFLTGCMLAGYNARWFDLPMLWIELYRCGFELDINPRLDVLDVCGIFKDRERRDLESAVRFYLDRPHAGHRATADVDATYDVFLGQLARYSDLPAQAEALALVGADQRIDIDGKFVLGEDGKAYFNFGKHKGAPCASQIGYLKWMLEKGTEFHPHSLKIVEGWLRK